MSMRSELSSLQRAEWPAFLRTNSGLPGPRADLRLAQDAADERWRVCEGVAMALQRAGDAGICEPWLPERPETAAAALRTCADATHAPALRAAGERRSDPVRTLCQALGYCWSVAVAADPATGLPAPGP